MVGSETNHLIEVKIFRILARKERGLTLFLIYVYVSRILAIYFRINDTLINIE